MKRKLFVILITGLFLALAIGTFSSVTANKVDNDPILSENDEGPCSITVSFVTIKGTEYTYSAKFYIDLIFSFSIPMRHYSNRIVVEPGSPSVEILNLPPGLYILHGFGFDAGFSRIPNSKYVLVGNGMFIPTHKDVTIKIIDTTED